MKSNVVGWVIALCIGAGLGGGLTLWFSTQTMRHVSTLQPPGVVLPDDAPSVPERIRIMELVCRDVLSQTNLTAAGITKIPTTCFLGVGDSQDPPPELLTALGGLALQVRPYSSAKWESGRVVDKDSGSTGLAVTLRRMWMRTQNEVHVRVRFDTGAPALPRELVCTVTRADNQWKVTEREPLK
jgi:hypothetical protein